MRGNLYFKMPLVCSVIKIHLGHSMRLLNSCLVCDSLKFTVGSDFGWLQSFFVSFFVDHSNALKDNLPKANVIPDKSLLSGGSL